MRTPNLATFDRAIGATPQVRRAHSEAVTPEASPRMPRIGRFCLLFCKASFWNEFLLRMGQQLEPTQPRINRARSPAVAFSTAVVMAFGSTHLLSAQHTATLESEALRIVVADNEAFEPVHRRGYNGVAELSLREDSSSLFLPAYAGLNLEHIFSGDDQSFIWNKFEPRTAPMKLTRHADDRVELLQERTEHWPLRSRIELSLRSDAIDFRYCGMPLEDIWSKHGYIGVFFASYIDQPDELGIHFLGRQRSDNDETEPAWIYHVPPAHGVSANHRPTGSSWDPPSDEGFNISLAEGRSRWEYSYPFYYGRSGDNVFIMMFGEPPQDGEIRFAQSPSGAGPGNPAWDFVFHKRNYAVNEEFCFGGRAVYKRYVSESDVVDIFEQWSGQEVHRPPLNAD